MPSALLSYPNLAQLFLDLVGHLVSPVLLLQEIPEDPPNHGINPGQISAPCYWITGELQPGEKKNTSLQPPGAIHGDITIR